MKITFAGNKKVNVHVKNFDILTDQSKEHGGDSRRGFQRSHAD